ncbi:phosphate transport system protein PhoU [Methanocella paludicola SANAE]|uniref:Phosphate-specific transport system accessory protein PhoU n=1 Tax=Methanocella paludicola (strain DSM 17711 / JCM 13418 / NBRC 101707 / SANAE) TaxID=304371 RepID=D1YWE5_METPS|nr:phosphate signaling complex protein PhoU [Methanocella paludicola]BAI60767.1 phosphate transport system protein PhoU [Methanocella paludicola SANAE]
MATVVSSRVDGIKADVLLMMGYVGLSIDEAVRSLDDRDVDTAKCVIGRDRQINEYLRRIEAECLDMLAKKLEGEELRTVAASYKLVSDVERIGDYCTAIANVTLAVANKPVTTTALDIIKMGRTALQMLNICMEAYKGRSEVNVEEVFDLDKSIDNLYNDSFVGSITSILREPNTITNVIYLTMASRALERIGDHLTDIAERIIFIRSGKIVERSEPMHVPEFPE